MPWVTKNTPCGKEMVWEDEEEVVETEIGHSEEPIPVEIPEHVPAEVA